MDMRSRPGVVGREVVTRKMDVATWLSCSRKWPAGLEVATSCLRSRRRRKGLSRLDVATSLRGRDMGSNMGGSG